MGESMVRQIVSLGLVLILSAVALRGADERPTEFSLIAPEAKAVFVAGEFNHWSTTDLPMQHDASGRWSAMVPLLPGKHAYKFIVDGEWKVDIANPEQAKDGFGGLNSVVTVKDSAVDPVITEKDTVRREAMRALGKSDFAQLEQTADDLRRNKGRFSDGLWKLKEFYEGLRARNEIGEEKDWQPWFEKLQRWREQFPDSMTVPVALGQGLFDSAGQSSDRKEADEKITQARSLLDDAAKSGARCPHWYVVMENIAMRQKWPEGDFAKLVTEAAEAEPTYYDYYERAATYSLSHSRARETLDRVAEEAAKLDSAEGMAAYARTVWFMENWEENVFEQTTVTWGKLRQGFLDIQKRYPESRWNANAFCRFAVQAKDRQTADLLFNQIGDHGDPNWLGSGRFEMAKKWANPSTPSWRVEPRLTITIPGKPTIHAVAFSPDGRSIATGASNGRVALWETSTGKQQWSEKVANFPVMSVAFSPDHKLLAAGAGQEYKGTEPGIAKVWDIETKKEVASAQPKGVVWGVAFTPDSRTLALSGGKWESKAESTLLNIASGELRELPWATGHDHILKGVAISPDGKTLVADCYQSITVWSLAESRVLFETRNLLKDFVLSLAFSPDGKMLATCGAPMRGRNDNDPGELALWDTATWKPRIPEHLESGGLIGIAFSPDGKLIAGGGYDEAVHVWDSSTLESKAVYLSQGGMIWTVTFSPDGKTVASAGDDGTLKFWTLP
jgi:WD40 repeat protein